MSKTPDFLVNPSPTFFRWARAQKNLSVDELSNKTEIPAQLIHELENDHSNKALPYCELVDIAEKYQHPIAAFFRRKTPPLKTTPPDRRSTRLWKNTLTCKAGLLKNCLRTCQN
jgi:transcriptional regulator with XRE-family HTH domain